MAVELGEGGGGVAVEEALDEGAGDEQSDVAASGSQPPKAAGPNPVRSA